MKKNLFLCTMVLAGTFSSCAQDDSLSPGAALLFKDVDSKLSVADKNEIFVLTEFQVAENQTQFHFDSEGASEFPFDAVAYPMDINEDGVEEVAVQFGNSFTSGMAGVSYFLLVQNSDGAYVKHFGFPGFLVLSSTKNLGYPDILVAGAGFQPYPVWRWNGENYAFHDKIEREIADKMPPVFMNEASKNYIDSLKN